MRKLKTIAITTLAGVAALGFTACAGAGSGTETATSQEVTEVTTAETTVSETTSSQTSEAKTQDIMKGIFEELTAEGSDYEKMKEQDTLTEYSEELDGDKITLSAKGDYVNGTWEYVKDGDYITATVEEDDLSALSMFFEVCKAAAKQLGLNDTLFNGYMKAVGVKELSTDYVTIEENEENKTATLKMYVGDGEYDLNELENIYLDQDFLKNFEPLGEDSTNALGGIGKMYLYYIGDKSSVDIYVGEYVMDSEAALELPESEKNLILGENGGRTELTYKSLVETVNHLKPEGYEDFAANYKELGESKGDNWEVSYPKEGDIPEVYEELDGDVVLTKVHFGK